MRASSDKFAYYSYDTVTKRNIKTIVRTKYKDTPSAKNNRSGTENNPLIVS